MPKVGTLSLQKLKASDCIAAARKLLETDRLLLAGKALDIAAGSARREKNAGTYVKQIEAVRKQLEAAQDKMLAAAQKDFQAGKHLEALTRYHTYARKFAGLRIAKVAAARIAEARKDAALQSVDKQAASEAAYGEVAALLETQWQGMLRSAKCGQPAPSRPPDEKLVAAMPIAKQAAVLKQLQSVLSACPGTSAAAKASALDKKLRENRPLVAAVEKWQADRDARTLFLKASLYESANSKKRAAQTYRLLIQKHPHCKYAGAAKSRLKLLQ